MPSKSLYRKELNLIPNKFYSSNDKERINQIIEQNSYHDLIKILGEPIPKDGLSIKTKILLFKKKSIYLKEKKEAEEFSKLAAKAADIHQKKIKSKPLTRIEKKIWLEYNNRKNDMEKSQYVPIETPIIKTNLKEGSSSSVNQAFEEKIEISEFLIETVRSDSSNNQNDDITSSEGNDLIPTGKTSGTEVSHSNDLVAKKNIEGYPKNILLSKFSQFGSEVYFKSALTISSETTYDYKKLEKMIVDNLRKLGVTRFEKIQSNYSNDVQFSCTRGMKFYQITPMQRNYKGTTSINDKYLHNSILEFDLRVHFDEGRINIFVTNILFKYRHAKIDYWLPIETIQRLTLYHEFELNKSIGSKYYQEILTLPDKDFIEHNHPKNENGLKASNLQLKNAFENLKQIKSLFENFSDSIASEFANCELSIFQNNHVDKEAVNKFLSIVEIDSRNGLNNIGNARVVNTKCQPNNLYESYSYIDLDKLKVPFVTIINLDNDEYFTTTYTNFTKNKKSRAISINHTSILELMRRDSNILINESVYAGFMKDIINTNSINIVENYYGQTYRKYGVVDRRVLKDRSETIRRCLDVKNIFSSFVGRKEDGSYNISRLIEYANLVLKKNKVVMNKDLEYDRVVDDAGIMFLLNTYYVVKLYDDMYIYRTNISKDDLTSYAAIYWNEKNEVDPNKVYKYNYLRIPIELVSIKLGNKDLHAASVSNSLFTGKINSEWIDKHNMEKLKPLFYLLDSCGK